MFKPVNEFFDAAEATDDDDDDSTSSSSSSSSSNSKPDQFCADIKVTLWNNSTRQGCCDQGSANVAAQGPDGRVCVWRFAQLWRQGGHAHAARRVGAVQAGRAQGQEVVFPVCVRRRDYIGGVQLALHLEDYSLDREFSPEPNLQTTVANSAVTIVAFPTTAI
jgi:hypothetical protein